MARQGTPANASDTTSGGEKTPAKRRTGVFEFIQQVRQETAKVTWPTRKETTVTTVMVFIMVLFAAIFFFVADQILRLVIEFILGLGR